MAKTFNPIVVLYQYQGESLAKIFDSEQIVLGRSVEVDFPIPDPNVSRSHLTIARQAGKLVVQDNGSANGTFINGHQIAPGSPEQVRASDVISIGNCDIKLQIRLAEKSYSNQKSFKIGFNSAESKEAESIIEEARLEAMRIIKHGQELVAKSEDVHKAKILKESREIERIRDQAISRAKLESQDLLDSAQEQINQQKKEAELKIKSFYNDKLEEAQSRVAQEEKNLRAQVMSEIEGVKKQASRIIEDARVKAQTIIDSSDDLIEKKLSDFLAEAKKDLAQEKVKEWQRLHDKFKSEQAENLAQFEELQSERKEKLDQLKHKIETQELELKGIESQIEDLLNQKESIQQDLDKAHLDKEALQIILRKQDKDIQAQTQALEALSTELEQKQQLFEDVTELINERQAEIERSLELVENHNQAVVKANEKKIAAFEMLNKVELQLKSVQDEYLEKSKEIEKKVSLEKKQLEKDLELFKESVKKEKLDLSKELRIEIETLTSQKNTLMEKRDQLLESTSDLEFSLSEKTAKLEDVTLKLHENSEELKKQSHSLYLCKTEKSALLKEIEDLKFSTEAFGVEKNQIESEVSGLLDNKNALLAEVSALDNKNKEQSEQNSRLEAEYLTFQLKLDKVRKELEVETLNQSKLKNEFEMFQAQLANKKSEYENLTSHFASSSLQLKEKFEKEMRDKEAEIKRLVEEKEHSEMRRVNKLLEERFADFNQKRDSIAKAIHYQFDSILVSKFEPHVFKEVSERLKIIVESALAENSVDESIEQLNEKVKSIKVGKYFSARNSMAMAVVALLIGLSVQPIYIAIDQQINGATYKDQLNARIDQQRKEYEARRFRPPQVLEWQDSYVDLVIYTEGFFTSYQDDSYIKGLNKELMNYMYSTYRIEEEKTIQASSKVLALVTELNKRFESIHPDFVDENIEKMRELENQTILEVEKVLGSKVRVEALFKTQKRYFEKRDPSLRMAN